MEQEAFRGSWIWWTSSVVVGVVIAGLIGRLIDVLMGKYRIARR